jgi:protein-disulfide isomerase
VLWFVLVLVLLLAPRSSAARENAPAYIFALSTAALSIVLYLAYGSFVVLKTVCPLCVATYVAVGGLFLISGGAMSFPMSHLPGRAARDLRVLVSSPAAVILAILFLGGAATAVAFFPREATPINAAPTAAPEQSAAGQAAAPAASQAEQSEFERWFLQQPKVDPGVPAEGAAVVIVKFNDYQCPPCKQTYDNYKSVLAKYRASHPGAVRFVTKDFPLDPECNFNAPGGQHVAACEAAVAVRLADEHAKREAMEDWLFANQPTLTPDSVKQGARQVGGVTDFDQKYPTVLNLVKGDIAAGGALGVRSTPTFFINGRMLRGGLPPQFFDAAIAFELKQAKR